MIHNAESCVPHDDGGANVDYRLMIWSSVFELQESGFDVFRCRSGCTTENDGDDATHG